MDELRHRLLALFRLEGKGLGQHRIQPRRQFRAVVAQRHVAQLAQVLALAHAGDGQAIGQLAAQHAVGDRGQREQVRGGRGRVAEQALRCHVLQGAGRHARFAPAGFGESADVHAGEVDQAYRAGLIEHRVLRAQVAVQHVAAVQGLHPAGELFDQRAHGGQRRPGVIDHPLRQGLTVDVFQRDEEVAAAALAGPGLDHMRTVHAAGHPLLERIAVEVGGVLVHGERRQLEHDRLRAGIVGGQQHMAAGAELELAHHGEALEHRPRRQGGCQRQQRAAQAGLHGVVLRQRVDAQQLQRGVVVAAGGAGVLHQHRRRRIEVVGVGGEGAVYRGRVELVAGAIGGEQVDLAGCGFPAAVVDLDVRGGAEGAGEIALARRVLDAVVGAELFECLRVQAIDARIADVQQVQVAALEDQGAEGAYMAAVAVEAALAAQGLAVQPGIGGLEHALRRPPHGPGVRGGVIVLEKAANRGLAGELAESARADAVGQRQCDALARQQVPGGQHGAVEVLIGRVRAGQRVLADAGAQGASHAGVPTCSGLRRRRAWGRSCSGWSTRWRRRR